MSSWRHTPPFSGFPMRGGPSGGATPPSDDAWDSASPEDPSASHDLRAEGASPAEPAGGAQPVLPDDDGHEGPAFAAELSFRRSPGVDAAAAAGEPDVEVDDEGAPAFEEFDVRSERVPFFRREVRFGRRKRREQEPAPDEEPLSITSAEWVGIDVVAEPEPEHQPEPELEPEAEPAPLFTRELSFRAADKPWRAESDDPDADVAEVAEEAPVGFAEEPAADVTADGRDETSWADEWEVEVDAVADDPALAHVEQPLEVSDYEPELELAAAHESETSAARVPFYKRSLTFRRRRQPESEVEPGPGLPEPALPEHLAEAEPRRPVDRDEVSGWEDPVSDWDEPSAGWDDDGTWGDPPSERPLALVVETPVEDWTEPAVTADVEPELAADELRAESSAEGTTEDASEPAGPEWPVSSEEPEPVVAEQVSDVLGWPVSSEEPEPEPVADQAPDEVEWPVSSEEPEPVAAAEPAWDDLEWVAATDPADPDRVDAGENEIDAPAPIAGTTWADGADDVSDELVVEEPGPSWASAAGEPEHAVDDTREPEQGAVSDWDVDDASEATPWAEPTVAASIAVEQDELTGEDDERGPTPAGDVDEAAARTRRRRTGKRSKRDAEPSRAGRGARGGKNRRRVVGLKIGASQLAAAVVSDRDGTHELVHLARSPLEPGIVVDGEIRDAESLAHALRRFFAEHDLPTRDVRVGLASNRIGVRTFDIVGVEDEDRFDNAVRFKAHEVLPIAVQESVLDYRVISERTTETGEALRRVLLVVAPREQVGPYVDVCRDAGIRVAGIDLEALGLLRAFVDPMPLALRSTEDNASVIVSIGHEATTLLVAGGGVCEFTRVFDWGGGTLQEAIANELQLPMAEAATVLRHVSLEGTSSRPLASIDDEQRRVAVEAVRLRLMPFARELVSSLQFYQTQPDSLGIGEIVITGGTAQLEGLGEALNQMLGVAVRLGDPFARVDIASDVDPHLLAAPGSLAVPVGLAIDDDRSRSVDLLPSESRQTTRRRPGAKAFALPAAALIPVAALAFLFTQANGRVGDREAQLSALQQELAALPEPKGVQIDPALQGEQAQRATAVADVLARRLAWDRVLGDLSRVVPENVWLTELTAKAASPLGAGVAQEAAASSRPTGVTINGFTYDHADVARLLSRLATVPSLANVELGSSTTASIGGVGGKGGKQVVQFTIVANMSQAGGAQ